MTAQSALTLPDSEAAQIQIWRAVTVAACVGMALVTITGILVPAGLGWDFANFYDTGRRAAAGQLMSIYDPTTTIAGQAPQGGMAFWGAPLSAWFYAPLSMFSPEVALILFKLGGSLAYAGGLVLLYRHLRGTVSSAPLDQARFAAVFSLAALVYQPFWTMYRVGGQTTPFVFLFLLFALLAHQRNQPIATALGLLAAVLFKPAFLIAPALLVLLSDRRTFFAIAGVFGAAGLLSVLLFGWPLHREFIDVLLRGNQRPWPWFFNSSVYILADAFRPIQGSAPIAGAGGPLPDLLRTALKAGVLGVFVWLALRSRKQAWNPSQRRHFNFLLAASFCLLLSQVVWEHYLAVLFLPLGCLLAAGPQLTRPARRLLAAIFVAALFQNLIFVMFFRSHVAIESNAALLAVSVVKSGTLLLYLLWLVWYKDLLFAWQARVPDTPFAARDGA